MKGKGLSRDSYWRTTRYGMKTIRGRKGQGSLDNIVVIDVDSDEFESVIIVDVPESLQQKSRGSSAVREGRRSPCIISVDDDDEEEEEEEECYTVNDHEINEQVDGNLDSDGTSSQSSPASDHTERPVHRDADGCRVAEENRPVFKLRKCNRTYAEKTTPRNRYGLGLDAEKATSGNRYGLDSDAESDSSADNTSDCEVMEGSFGEVREQWEKASLKRKSMLHKGLDDQASPSSSHSDVHPTVEVENRTKQNSEPAVCSNSKDVNFDKVNSFASTAAGDGVLGGFPSSAKTGNPFAKSNQKDRNFSGSWKSRADENIHFHWTGDDLFGGETFSGDISCNKFQTGNGPDSRFPTGPSSRSNQVNDGKKYHNSTCSHDMEQNTTTEHSFPNIQRGPSLYFDDGKASDLNDNDSFPDGHCFDEIHTVSNSRVASKEEVKEFTQVPSSCKTCSNEGKCREKLAFCTRSSEDKVVENVVAPMQEVSDEKSDHDERAPREKSLQCHDTLSKQGISNSAEGKEVFTDFASSSQLCYEGDPFCASHGDLLLSAEKDIINGREKLKETDEYKQAIEEEWAARQRQLQIQAEEVRRLRKRRKAETLRILDMERRQKQRLEEVRETQKKDEENLNMKERFRVEVRKELSRLEITCFNMASLLRGLGIHVEGGFNPLPNQVHAAYKRALLKLHPDRASKTDLRQQVEAEEKFKLLSRMKEKFLSTSYH
ncbi:CHAPERONE DNAJ-DOMAIN SUPERFAMILY PROTEIN [Salix viminalis]|uniref:CHAPERONE DNAJ-DOMAIN SUPERFAMILY PROTEIN n=1 Tax=Salix viminalis TaxID=40686 RepID=A0A9Q0U053_SALVM|nr:CHAPERONE DNAJ-DOMAIN SUPERFAMILY PROTEIN [Salix viminalis]